MKIAHIVCTFPPYKGGMGNSAYNFSKILAQRGHEVTVFTTDYNAPQEEISRAIKIELVKLKPWLKIGNGAILPQLFRLLDGYDIVHLHYPFYGSAEIVLLKKLLAGAKMKLALHYHMDNQAGGIKGVIFKLYRLFLLPLLARSAKAISCASIDYIKHSYLAGYYKKRQEKFKETCFGVAVDFFTAKQNSVESGDKGKTILFVGSLDKAHYFKGLENLFSAARKLKGIPTLSNIKLEIVGDGDMKDYYQSLVKKHNLVKLVNFNDKITDSELVNFYRQCDVLVLPSVNKSEAFGLVLLEAMACAKPVIASNLPGVRSVFRNGREGLLARPGDVKDLISKLKIILTDDSSAEAMGRAGRELVKKKYTWDKVGDRLEALYYYVKYCPK